MSVAPLLAVGLVGVRVGVLVLVTGEVAESAPFWALGVAAIGIAAVVGVGWWTRRSSPTSTDPAGRRAVLVTLGLGVVAVAVGGRAWLARDGGPSLAPGPCSSCS